MMATQAVSSDKEKVQVMNRSLIKPLAMFAVAVAFYLYEFLLRVAPQSMYADLMRDFNIDAENLGYLYSIYFLPYALLQLPVGAWTDKLGPRRLLTVAIILCSVSTLLFAKTNSFFMACFARFFIGAGSAFAFISCMKIITVWFPPRLFPVLTGLTLTFGSLGAVAGVSSVSFALELASWRDLFLILGITGSALGLLAWIYIRDGQTQVIGPVPDQTGVPVGFWTSLIQVIRSPQNWMVAIYGFMTTSPSDAFGGLWGTPYLVQVHGIEKAYAATAVSMTFVGMALGSPLMGLLSNVWQSRRRPMIAGAVLATLSLLMIIYYPQLTLWSAGSLFFAFGLFGTYVMSFIVIRDINSAQLVGTAVGFVNSLSMLGSMLISAMIGVILGKISSGALLDGVAIYTRAEYQQVLLILPLFYVITVLLMVPFIKESYSHNQKA